MNQMSPTSASPRYRTVVISDAHLGTRGCQAGALGDFLESIAGCDHLFIVGDLIDGWRLMRHWYWTDEHTRVIRKIMRLARFDTEVVLVPGNHDEFLRYLLALLGLTELQLGGNVWIKLETVYKTPEGKKYLITHGDEFDGYLKLAPLLSHLGDHALAIAQWLNTILSRLRHMFGCPYWSLSRYLKFKVKKAVQYTANFEKLVANKARERRVDGVVCGHIHHPQICEIEGVIYMNSGDFVENCSALVEHYDGRWQIVYPASQPVSVSQQVEPAETAAATLVS
jgi:UDP-2,3-diacylglucosamine pyrophosphatase LpxH